LTKQNACRKKETKPDLKHSKAHNSHPHSKLEIQKKENCLLEPCLLGYEDYKEQLAYLHQCKQQEGGSNNKK